MSGGGRAAESGLAEPGDTLLDVRGLRIESRVAGRRHTIVSTLDLTLAAGETVGIVGESGSGKSMTARALIGLLPQGVRASGDVRYQGRNLLSLPERALAEVRGSEIGLVLQDPFTMLNPLLRCGSHITETLRGKDGRSLGRRRRRAEAVRRLAEVGIVDDGVADRFPFQLSGGMRQRVGIAASLARDPKLLIADEPSTALDVTTQKEILVLLKSLQSARGMGLILITHDLRVAFSICDRIHVLYAGSLLEVGAASGVEREPLHPYTLGLLLSEPPGDRRLAKLATIEGSVPSPDEIAGRCPFSPRCRWAAPRCVSAPTPLRPAGAGRLSACVRVEEIRGDMTAARRRIQDHARVAAGAPVAEPLVEVRDLWKVFGHGAVTAVGGVSLDIGACESVGLVGESGSGKTTIGRCLVGLETPTEGAIVIGGVSAGDYTALSRAERLRVRRTIQIVFQDPYSSLNPARSIGSTLQEAVRVQDPRARDVEARALALLERVGLPRAYAARKPVALSGGERQRVAIARALAVKPKVIVCDEPVSALDASVQAQILELLKSLREELGMSYLFITHDLAVVRQIAERIYVLYRGRIVEAGSVEDVLDRPQHDYTIKLVDSIPRADVEWLAQTRVPSQSQGRR